MRKFLFIMTLLLVLSLLSSCRIKPLRECDPEYVTSKEQIEQDLMENEEDFRKIISMLYHDEWIIDSIYYRETKPEDGVYVYIYQGSLDEYRNDYSPNRVKYGLHDVVGLTEEDKAFIEDFMINRDTEVFSLHISHELDGYIEFSYYGPHHIEYENNEFIIEDELCQDGTKIKY